MVLSHSDVFARIVDRTALTDNDVAGDAGLSAEDFHAQTFAFGFTTIAGTTDTFFMSHNIFVLKGFFTLCLLTDYATFRLVDAVDLNLGQIVTVTIHLLESFTTDFLEDEDLLAFKMFHHGSLNAGAIDVRLANGNVTIIVFEHHGVKRDLATLLILKAVDEDLLILGYLELLSCDFYYCVHF